MNDRAIAKVPLNQNNRPSVDKSSSNSNGGFGFFTLPFFGPSIICIIIIGQPGRFFKFAKGVGRQMRTRLLQSSTQKKLDSGVSGKPLMIPVAYSGIQGVLSGLRGVEDDANVLAAGTLTGLLYRASSGNLLSCGVGGLTGLLLSSLYCSLKPQSVIEMVQENKHDNEYNSDFDEDPWKPQD